MTKPVHFKQHTLEEPVVLDGIKAINTLKDANGLAGRVSGGMGVQSYIPAELHRGTIDLDYSMIWQGNFTDYKELCKPLVDFLRFKGYEPSFKKKGLAFEVTYNRDAEGSFMIQHPNRSPRHFNRIRRSLEREDWNKRRVSRAGVEFDVLSPEDIIATKLHRILLFSHRYGLKIPGKEDVELSSLRKTSEALVKDIVSRTPEISPKDVALLRMINDLYDISCLSESIPLDGNYLGEVLEDWSNITEDVQSMNGLWRTVNSS